VPGTYRQTDKKTNRQTDLKGSEDDGIDVQCGRAAGHIHPDILHVKESIE
jgi:hypothetical protein